MYRTRLIPMFLLASVASAQDHEGFAKQPAALPHMEDVKTAPFVYAKESGEARRADVDVPLSSPAARNERAQKAAGFAHGTPQYPLFDVDGDGVQWVRGATYKASFGPSGATYVPFLGSEAPRSWPMTMHIQSITAAGQPIAFEPSAHASRAGTTISLDHGSVVEQYLIDRDGLEQRFVFDTLPARGEIVVTLDVETELDGRVVDGALRFENEHGHAAYGRAWAKDGGGRTAAMEERLENGRIQLVVPAEFVATAELPLVVDPYVSTFAVANDLDEDFNADIALVTQANATLIVYESVFSATDHDIFAAKYVSTLFAGQTTIDISTTDWRNPRVAANELSERFLCVAEVGAAGSRIIRGRTIEAAMLAQIAPFTISGTESGDKHNPDVGGDPVLVGPTYFCVVWQRDFAAGDTDIHARLVSSTGTPVGTTVIFLENSAATLDSTPSISKTDGNAPFASQDWSIVWTHAFSSTDDDLQGARIRWDGMITAPTFVVAATTTNERLPTASEPLDNVGLQRPWLTAYTYGSSLRFRAYEGTSVIDTLDLAAGSFQSYSAPDLTTDGRLWMLAFTQRQNTIPFADTDVRAATLTSAGGSLAFSENPIAIADSASENEVRPRIATGLSGTNPFRSYIAYDRDSASNGLDVMVGVYNSPVNAGGFSYCFGTAATCPCGNAGAATAGCASSVNPSGATLVAAGQWAVTDDTAVLTASGMPATASALYFQGTGQIAAGSVFGDGLRCASGTTRRLATKTSVSGSSHYPAGSETPIHIRGAVPNTGGWRYYQAWYRNSGAFCTSSTFNLTNGVALLWAP